MLLANASAAERRFSGLAVAGLLPDTHVSGNVHRDVAASCHFGKHTVKVREGLRGERTSMLFDQPGPEGDDIGLGEIAESLRPGIGLRDVRDVGVVGICRV